MKIRDGFVSNSSSSSFTISSDKITAKQLNQIVEHETECEHYGMSCDYDEVWSISNDINFIKGETWMDNFSMSDFLRHIGIDSSLIDWNS